MRVESHKGCPIYIRRLDTRFEYLVIYKNQLYSNYFDMRPSWLRRIFFAADEEKLYTKKHRNDILNLVIKGAHITIDELKKKK